MRPETGRLVVDRSLAAREPYERRRHGVLELTPNGNAETLLRIEARVAILCYRVNDRRRRAYNAQRQQQVIGQLLQLSSDELNLPTRVLASEPEHPVPEVRVD